MIVVFDRLPDDAIERFIDAGITHAALFEAADAAAVLGPARAYRTIASWTDVRTIYPETRFRPTTFQTKVTLRVDRVHAGARPLRTPYTGKGVTVAVLDTGVENTHPDLDDRVVMNLNFEPSAVLDEITDGEYSRSNAQTPMGFDEFQHGTLVSGIVAGTGEAGRGADMRGMAPQATLVNMKIIGQATHEAPQEIVAHEASALAAYQWILDHQHDPVFPGGIRLATNSWGFEGEFEPIALTRILRRAVDEGIALVFAAGNSGPSPNTVIFPGRLPWIITVGATCKAQGVYSAYCGEGAGQVADFSSRGMGVDVMAPGVDIWGPLAKAGYETVVVSMVVGPRPDWFPPGPGQPPPEVPMLVPPAPGADGNLTYEIHNRLSYGFSSGTSFATPHVGGIVALMLEANPDLTQAQIQSILQKTATDLGPKGFDTDTGYGMVNALNAVAAAEKLAREPARSG